MVLVLEGSQDQVVERLAGSRHILCVLGPFHSGTGVTISTGIFSRCMQAFMLFIQIWVFGLADCFGFCDPG